MADNDDYLFDKDILQNCFDHLNAKNGIDLSRARRKLLVRPLRKSDFHRGYLDVLAQLTVVGEVTEEDFVRRFNRMQACKDTYFIVVIEDTSLSKVIGSGTLVVEHQLNSKLKLSSRGRVEDIVVDQSYRGMQLGKLMLETVATLAKKLGCTDNSLECKDPLLGFYSQFGFEQQRQQAYMSLRFI